VELKTLPLTLAGQPCESTFVCAIPKIPEAHWQNSLVQRKLATVLWIPILSDQSIPFLQRPIGTSLLWSPSAEQETLLREDWEELTELLMLGKADRLTAQHGRALQVRPKAAHSRILRQDINGDGESVLINPRGFYLRASFTAEIVRENYLRR
jgi:DNA mismatch repair protein MutH